MAHTVLLIDDDPDSRQICRTILTHHGFLTMEARTAAEGIGMMRERAPDAVLMDVNLPGLDGWTATRMIKQAPETGRIPVVIFTARATGADRDRAALAGCDGYITKPCSPKRIVEEVKRVLAPVRRPDAGGGGAAAVG